MGAEIPEAGATLDLRVAPDARQSAVVRRRILDFAAEHRIELARMHDFITALGEAFANAVEHAQTPDVAISVWIVQPNRLFATVTDRGIGFHQNGGQTRAQLPANSSERGRGLPIMRSCTDVFSIRSTPGVGTCVVLGTEFTRC